MTTLKTTKTERPFSNTGGGEGMDSLGKLKLTREGIRVVFPHLVLEVSKKYYCDYRASIISKGSKIDTERMLREMFSLLIEEREAQGWLRSAILNFRDRGHNNVQFLNGHLERNEGDEMMPMREVMNASDKTMLRRLVSLDLDEVDSLSKLVDPYYRQTDIRIGWMDRMWSWINRKKSKEEVAKILGFETVSKTSEGQISNGNGSEIQTCLATRLCVHSEELKNNGIIDSAVDTFRRMGKLRKDPSFVMGVEDVIEIHAGSGGVSLRVYDDDDKAIFLKFLRKLLKIVGAEDFSKAKVQVERKVYVPDSPLKKTADKIDDHLTRNQSKICFGLVAISLSLIAAYLFAIGYLEAIAIIIPVLCILAVEVWLSSEERWIARIGQRSHVLMLWIIATSLYLLLLFLGSEDFLEVMVFVAVIVTANIVGIVIYLKTKEEKKKLSELINLTKIRLERAILRILANGLVKAILMLFVIILGIIAAFSFSLLLIPLLIGYYLFFVLLNKNFRDEVERDREERIDKFFHDFRGKRGLPLNCEVRFNVSKCGSLRNPLGGAFGKSIKFGRSKFPERLTLPNVLKFCYGGLWKKINEKVEKSK